PYARLSLLSFPTRRSSDLNRGGMVDARPDRILDLDQAAQHQVGVADLPVDRGTLQVGIEPFAGGDQAGEVIGPIVEHGCGGGEIDRKSTRLNSSHQIISYA